jgi:hypothetical protein
MKIRKLMESNIFCAIAENLHCYIILTGIARFDEMGQK